jgi:hypothetical protein
MKMGQNVIYVGYNSDSNGHAEQSAIITGVVNDDPAIVNLRVFPDAAEDFAQQNARFYPNEALAQDALANGQFAVCYPA